MPSTPPSSRIALVAPDAWPAWSVRTDDSTALAAGANTSAIPLPASTNGIDQARVALVDARLARDPAERERLQRQSGDHEQPAAVALREEARERRDDHRRAGPDQQLDAGLQRRVVQHVLQELAQEEDRAEHPEVHRQRDDVGDREAAVGEEAHRQHRLVGAQLLDDEREHQQRAGGQRDQRPGCSSNRATASATSPNTIPNRPVEAEREPAAGRGGVAVRGSRSAARRRAAPARRRSGR